MKKPPSNTLIAKNITKALKRSFPDRSFYVRVRGNGRDLITIKDKSGKNGDVVLNLCAEDQIVKGTFNIRELIKPGVLVRLVISNNIFIHPNYVHYRNQRGIKLIICEILFKLLEYLNKNTPKATSSLNVEKAK